MTQLQYVEIVNNCPESLRVFLRRPRPKKGPSKLPASFALAPAEKSLPLPQVWLIGAKDWERLANRACVQIVNVAFDPQYVRILNVSSSQLELRIRARRPVPERPTIKLSLSPRKPSRILDVKAISDRAKLNKLVATKQVRLVPVFDIGPASGERHVRGSYYGEDVYTCDKCGGPIVFRGSPPTPIHVS